MSWAPFAALSGLAVEVGIETGSGRSHGAFVDDLLFTHRGLSGPAVLQISSHWQAGTPIVVDLAPGRDLAAELEGAKSRSRRKLGNELTELMPRRLADAWLADRPDLAGRPMAGTAKRRPRRPRVAAAALGTEAAGNRGLPEAEVTAGGVDTRQLDSQTMQSKLSPGLYFIGEVVDVTVGWVDTTFNGPGQVRRRAVAP